MSDLRSGKPTGGICQDSAGGFEMLRVERYYSFHFFLANGKLILADQRSFIFK
jgi:hypothetical protein